MSAERQWLVKLMDEVRAKRELVELLTSRGEQAIERIKNKVEEDVYFLNRELYSNDEILYVEVGDYLDFTISNYRTDGKTRVKLVPENELLSCEFTGLTTLYLFAMPDKDGGVSFYDGRTLVTLGRLSQRLIEPLVKAQYNLLKG